MNLDKMTYLQLLSLRDEVTKHINAAEARARVEARDQIRAIAHQHGLSLRDLSMVGRPRKAKSQTPKHRNPSNPSQTWSGRGRPPKWFKKSA